MKKYILSTKFILSLNACLIPLLASWRSFLSGKGDSDPENEELLDDEGNENDNVSNNEIIFPDEEIEITRFEEEIVKTTENNSSTNNLNEQSKINELFQLTTDFEINGIDNMKPVDEGRDCEEVNEDTVETKMKILLLKVLIVR